MIRLSRVLDISVPEGDPDDGLIYRHGCQGCNSNHLINVELPNSNGAKWTFDGNIEKPTFSPSINIVGHCHYFITEGNIVFCSDSNHHRAGQTVPRRAVDMYERAVEKANAEQKP